MMLMLLWPRDPVPYVIVVITVAIVVARIVISEVMVTPVEAEVGSLFEEILSALTIGRGSAAMVLREHERGTQ
jgi:hypothetical protein